MKREVCMYGGKRALGGGETPSDEPFLGLVSGNERT